MATRRSAEQWQALIELFHESGLAAPQFCQRESIGYQSFLNWKKRLVSNKDAGQSKSHATPTFVELTQEESSEPSWLIELDLAPGVQLRIARPA